MPRADIDLAADRDADERPLRPRRAAPCGTAPGHRGGPGSGHGPRGRRRRQGRGPGPGGRPAGPARGRAGRRDGRARRRPQPAPASSRRASGRPAADRRRCRLRQDPRAHPSDRPPAGHRRRAARRDPRDHLHQQGGRRDARARRGCRRAAGPGDVGLDLPLGLRADPAQGCRPAGPEVQLLDLRPGRQPAPGHPRLPGPGPGPEADAAPGAAQQDLRAEERAGRRRHVPVPGGQRHRADPGRRLCLLPGSARPGAGRRLRRPDRAHRRPARRLPRRRRALPPAIPPHPRRRVPGHQPRAVPPGRRAGRPGRRRGPPGRAGGRRRLRPVDLRLPRRDGSQHRGVQHRLPRCPPDRPRPELPFDPDDPLDRQRGHRQERRPAGQEAVDRCRGGRAGRGLRRRLRARRSGVRRKRDRPARRRRPRQAR